MQFQENFFSKNRQTLFGALKYRQTLFNTQILFYKDFYDFTHQSPVVNGFPSFAMNLREANWRPTYLPRILMHDVLRSMPLEATKILRINIRTKTPKKVGGKVINCLACTSTKKNKVFHSFHSHETAIWKLGSCGNI